jgi:hypothetical protein
MDGRLVLAHHVQTLDGDEPALVCAQEYVGEAAAGDWIAIGTDVDPLDKQVTGKDTTGSRQLLKKPHRFSAELVVAVLGDPLRGVSVPRYMRLEAD